MNFKVDKIYEDSFYNNMLLGLPKILDKKRKIGVKSRHLTRYPPALPEEINAWEKRYAVALPPDMKQFYSSTNGFLFKWHFMFGDDDVEIIGKIDVNSIENLKQIFGYSTNNEPGIMFEDGRYVINLGLTSKVFEIANIYDKGIVVLVYVSTRFAPTVWFSNNKRNFYYLANNFTTYFCMAIAHLGIPCWQFRFAPEGLPPWSEGIFRVLAPHLLEFKGSVESLSRTLNNKKKCGEIIINKLNLHVFSEDYVLPKMETNFLQKFKPEKEPNKEKEKSKLKKTTKQNSTKKR